MKVFQANEIKNLVLIGSTKSGKTTLAETMMFEGGVIERRGTVSIDIQGGSSPYTGIATDNNSGVITTHLMQNDSIITGITSGAYTMSVTDANNCPSVLQQGGINQQTITTGITVSAQISPNVSQFGGPVDNSTAPGAYSNYNGHLNLNCNIPSKLVSAVVYAGASNTITFELRDNTGAVLDDTTITVQLGQQRLYFDFDIPIGTDLELGVSAGNTQLYRNNAGNGNSMLYPYNIGNNITITSSGAGNQYYYFYYDLEIASPASIACWNGNDGALQVLNPDPTFSYVWEEVNNPGFTIDTGIQADSLYAGSYIVMAQFSAPLPPQFGGPLDTSIGTGGHYNGDQHLELDCNTPSKLVSAVVYADTIKTITFELRDNTGSVLDDTTITVQIGEQRLYFDFDIPIGTDLELGVSAANTDLYRNNGGVNYPYDIGSFLSITGSSAGNQYYYFYYDLEIQPIGDVVITGCTDTSQIVIVAQPSQIVISSLVDDVSCFGGNDGEISLTVSGGTPGNPAYTHSWNNGQTTNPATGLQIGTFTDTVRDGNGCEVITTFTINEPLDLSSTISTSNYSTFGVSCFGGNDGTISLTVDQNTGTAPFTYSWNSGQTALNLSNLPAGQYTVIITDAKGCTYTNNTTLTAPNQIVVSPTISSDFYGANISCYGASDGEAIVSTSGGVQPYDVLWSNTSTNATISNLVAGTYIATITDENGCIEIADITLVDPPLLEVDVDVRDSLNFNVSCFGLCDGWALATPHGGTTGISGDYFYSWSDGQSSSLAEGLCAGMAYTITVTDANGCTESSTTITFTEPPVFEAEVTATNYFGPAKPPLNVNFADSTYLSTIHPMLFTWLWPDGIIEPVSWDFGNPGMNISYSFTDIGENKVNLIVLNRTTGCADTIDFVIDVQGLGKINNVFSPNGDGVNDVFTFENHGMDILSVMIFNRWGQKIYETDVSSSQWDGKDLQGNEQLAGTYFYVLTAQGKDGYRYEEKGAIILLRE